MGYAGVEFSGYYNTRAADLRNMLDDNGLKAAGSHIGIHTLLGDELGKTASFNLTIGNRFLMCRDCRPHIRRPLKLGRKRAGLFEVCETVGGTQWYIIEQES